ncbi:ribosome biogenesis GTP-binding protein YihA/YsxC [Pseudomonadota bacterium]
MNHPLYHRAVFTTGAHNLSQVPPETEGLIEVAFAGRSNAGKSSAINRITHQKSLARTSKTPGRTQQINFFQLEEKRFIVDLPGYGYAKVSEKVKRQWQHTLELYLRKRECLRGLVLMMDVRHPLTDFDTQMLSWCQHAEMPVHILITKADKLGRGAAGGVLQTVRNVLAKEFGVVREDPWATAQLFSALKGTGLEEAQAKLDEWFEYRA